MSLSWLLFVTVCLRWAADSFILFGVFSTFSFDPVFPFIDYHRVGLVNFPLEWSVSFAGFGGRS